MDSSQTVSGGGLVCSGAAVGVRCAARPRDLVQCFSLILLQKLDLIKRYLMNSEKHARYMLLEQPCLSLWAVGCFLVGCPKFLAGPSFRWSNCPHGRTGLWRTDIDANIYRRKACFFSLRCWQHAWHVALRGHCKCLLNERLTKSQPVIITTVFQNVWGVSKCGCAGAGSLI